MTNKMSDFKTYLIEIGRYPLLNAEQEIELAKQARDGNENAREQLICSNLRLVVSVAKRYKNSRLTLADLVEEGNIGLITAVEKYNPDLGYRFSTCATPWIKQAISKAITDKGRTIRIPAHIYNLFSKYRQAVNAIEADGHNASDEEVAKYLGVEVDKIRQLKEWKKDTISIETPLGNENEDTIGDLIADPYSENPMEVAERISDKERIHKMLQNFKPRTQEIMKLRYGLGADGDEEIYFQPHTLEEIGAILGITRERVRQIEKQTLVEMRAMWERA